MSDKPKIVADIMTRRVATLREEESIELAEAAMERFRFRHIPVVDGAKDVGLVSHRNMLRASATRLDPKRDVADRQNDQRVLIRDVMKTDVTTIAPDMAVSDAARLMLANTLDCLPVTDAEGRLLGIVTASDFLKLAIKLLERGQGTL